MGKNRKSGVLLHPTSLPGSGGIGSLGAESLRFVDFLRQSGQSLWQVLPLGPTAYGNSPYSCYSAFAGNPLLVNLELIAAEGDLETRELNKNLPAERIDYQAVETFKLSLLGRAAARFFTEGSQSRMEDFWRFCDTTFWLHDYALFMALKAHFMEKSWCDWPSGIARRTPDALAEYSEKLGPAIGEQKYIQWQFFCQWRKVREYANANGIEILGDIPIFVAFDSVDVWANTHLFKLDDNGRPTVVAGVPPDYFSKTGQLWGNPTYDWERIGQDGFGWWIARIRNDLSLYDMVRVDHFRGFEACWEVAKGEKTAMNGTWVNGPGENLFNALIKALGPLPLIAEDLGVITPEVEALRDKYRFPGMKILQFAFDSGPENPYLPHNYTRECVVYTGTHDNDTSLGWFRSLKAKSRNHVLNYLQVSADDIVWEFIRTALASVADYAVIPMQDLLGLDADGRMNIPGVAGGNWSWRCCKGDFSAKLAIRLKNMTELYGRLPC